MSWVTEPQERTPVQAEQSLVPEPTQQGVVVSGRSEIGTDTHTGQLVHIQDQTLIYINDGTQFKPQQ